MELKQSATRTRTFLMIDAADHISGKTGLTVTVTVSKNGGVFAAAAGAVSEVGNGWYKVAYTIADTNTLGDLSAHATATGADPTDWQDQVVAYDPNDGNALGLARLDLAISGIAAAVWAAGARTLTAFGFNVAVADKTGYSLAITPPTSQQVAAQVWAEPIPGGYLAGSAGARLNSAASAGDPLASAVPGSYPAGSAGYLIGTRLDAPVSSIAPGGQVGAGSRSTTVTVTWPDGVTPIEGVAVWVTTDAAGTNVVAGTLYTDTQGHATFLLDPGTYYLWRQLSGFNFANPQTLTVV
jgi:hypothetical protein